MARAEDPGVEDSIEVELAWSPHAGEVRRRMLTLPQGATIADAIARSACALPRDLAPAVWGRARDATHPLRDGDRLELLRPLAADPMEAPRDASAVRGR